MDQGANSPPISRSEIGLRIRTGKEAGALCAESAARTVLGRARCSAAATSLAGTCGERDLSYVMVSARCRSLCRVAFRSPTRNLFGRFLYSFSLIRASSTQDVSQRIISFVTRVFK